MLTRGHSGDGCVLASTLCKYDLRKGDLFVVSWARVRRGSRGSFFSDMRMCGRGVRSILLLPLVSCVHPVAVLNADLQFVNAGRGCNWRPYRRGIIQSRSHNCFIGSHECLLLLQ